MRPLGEQLHTYILPDVHPPLYAAVLRAWVLLTGTGEIATRALSLLFALTAFVCVSVFASSVLDRRLAIAAAAIFSSNWLFAFYAQDTRPYAMLLALSAIVTSLLALCISQSRTRWFPFLLLSALLLSLTHYFGLIYAGICLLAALFWYRQVFARAAAIIVTGLACLVWPVIHVTAGTLLGHSEGDFWIESNGLQTTLAIACRAILPALSSILSLVFQNSWRCEQATSAAFVVASLAAGFAVYRASRREIWSTLYAAMFATVAVVALIDQISPMSTLRNYIVVLPAAAILGAVVLNQLLGGRWILVAAFCVVGVAISATKVYRLQAPLEGIRQASEFIDQHLASDLDAKGFYLDGQFYSKGVFGQSANFYSSRHLKGVTADQISHLQPPFYILALHQRSNVEELLNQSQRGLKKFTPSGTRQHGDCVVLYIPDNAARRMSASEQQGDADKAGQRAAILHSKSH